MALEQNLNTRSYEAGGDLSGNQFYFVTQAADGQVDTTGAGLQATGVLQDDNGDAAGKVVAVAVGGRSKVSAGAAISVGDNVASDGNGQAVTATTGDVILGVARSAAGAAGEIVSVELTIPSAGTA